MVALARAAATRGREALAVGDRPIALRWLDRGHRLVPRDLNMTLSLATACLGHDDARAAALFTSVTAECDVREAWLGLAAARSRLGNAADAADALASALARHAAQPGTAALADGIARAARTAGWCGLAGDGTLLMRCLAPGTAERRLDGQQVGDGALPRAWAMARELTVTLDGQHLIGSPIDLAAIRRTFGFVEAWNGGLRGWAWHPGDPDRAPVLTIAGATGGRSLRVVATDLDTEVADAGPLARPRGFAVTADALAGMTGPLHVRGPEGGDLLGSPVDPLGEQRAAAAAAAAIARQYPASGARWRGAGSVAAAVPVADAARPLAPAEADPRRRPVAIVIPVHGQPAATRACLDSVLASVDRPNRIVVVDDGSAEPDLIAALDALARARRVTLLRHPVALGFPASANAGLVACPGHDVVLLNSDTLVPPGWLERLRDAALSAPDIGTVTPLSNDAGILSYPGGPGANPAPDQAGTIRLDRAAWRANGAGTIEIPVGVGFCLYIRRDCLDAVGLLRADLFAQGYGEESDFCLRARHLGWRHMALPGLFVAHRGGTSFGPSARHLRARNEALLNRLHPGYQAMIAAFGRTDPLTPARRRLDLERWRARRPRGCQSVILITHAEGGGVEERIVAAAEAHRAAGQWPIVLRPGRTADGKPAVVVGDGPEGLYPNLCYVLPDELPALLRLLRATRPVLTEVHHLLGHDPAILVLVAQLGVSYDVHVHDYAWFCPRISLVGPRDAYCGEPAPRACEACVTDTGSLLTEDIGVTALRARSAGFLADARRVVTPSRDAAARMTRHFPALRPVAVPHQDDRAIPPPAAPRLQDGLCRVCVAGSIGVHKGYDVLLACARDAAWRDLPLEFIVVGSTIDDARLLATGRAFVTGVYRRHEAVALIRGQRASLGFVPSIWPETWCLALTELWQAGLQAVSFDIGAPAERIRRTGWGVTLPPGLPPDAINDALIAAAATRPTARGKPVHVSSTDPSMVALQGP